MRGAERGVAAVVARVLPGVAALDDVA